MIVAPFSYHVQTQDALIAYAYQLEKFNRGITMDQCQESKSSRGGWSMSLRTATGSGSRISEVRTYIRIYCSFFFSFRTRTASKASNVYETIVKQAIPMLTASMGIVQYLLFFLPNFQPRVA